MVRLKVEYCASLWDPHTKNNIEQSESVQSKAARAVKGDFDRETSVTAMIYDLECNWQCFIKRSTNQDVDADIPLQKACENHKYI